MTDCVWAGGTTGENNSYQLKYGPSADKDEIIAMLSDGESLFQCLRTGQVLLAGTQTDGVFIPAPDTPSVAPADDEKTRHNKLALVIFSLLVERVDTVEHRLAILESVLAAFLRSCTDTLRGARLAIGMLDDGVLKRFKLGLEQEREEKEKAERLAKLN